MDLRKILVAFLFFTGSPYFSKAQDGGEWRLPSHVQYRHIVRQDPRPLHIHGLTIDLRAQDVTFTVVSGDDPDGEGPTEAVLTSPNELAKSVDSIATINTAAWQMLTDPVTGKKPGYIAGGRADILGWVQQADRIISRPQPGYWSLWMEASGTAAIGEIATTSDIEKQRINPRWAISGFRGILKDGQVLAEPSDVKHPRTAVGLNSDGTKMVWVVVDGRQQGYSEGVSEEELAKILIEFGCQNGINLDGGGSSSMWLRNTKNELTTANRPSDAAGPRPVPVVLNLLETKPLEK